MDELLNGFESSSLAISIRQSLWLYPGLEIVHILGIVILVGPAFMFDLRLLGFSRNLSVTALSRHLLPWSRRGLLLIIPSGILLFVTNAKALGTDPVFWLKMGLLVVAALNVFVFHKFVFNPVSGPELPGELPLFSKVSAIISIMVWIAVITCGRLLAY